MSSQPTALITTEPADKNNSHSIKSFSIDKLRRQQITITKCLCQPCPIYYTDALLESILIECKDPKHDQNVRYVEQHSVVIEEMEVQTK